MSGTSLDGLDLALCSFSEENGSWQYNIDTAETLPYSLEWMTRLQQIEQLSALDLTQLDLDYGHYLGNSAREFLKTANLKADYIASHGHTVFHRPELGLTLQIGSGALLSASSGLPVVCDFRTQDVGMGGQGAPLVPLGDALLFGAYDYCLNLGGFSNISFRQGNERLAFDISPCNIVLNTLARKAGHDYDAGGKIAASGKVNSELLERLNSLDFYKMKGPKSLGREWVESVIFPLLEEYALPIADLLRTYVEHISDKIAAATQLEGSGQVLTSGGGAKNDFLIQRIQEKTDSRLIIPDLLCLDFKEALIFAFLGLLRIQGRNNILSAVTGSKADHCGGCIYLP